MHQLCIDSKTWVKLKSHVCPAGHSAKREEWRTPIKPHHGWYPLEFQRRHSEHRRAPTTRREAASWPLLLLLYGLVFGLVLTVNLEGTEKWASGYVFEGYLCYANWGGTIPCLDPALFKWTKRVEQRHVCVHCILSATEMSFVMQESVGHPPPSLSPFSPPCSLRLATSEAY